LLGSLSASGLETSPRGHAPAACAATRRAPTACECVHLPNLPNPLPGAAVLSRLSHFLRRRGPRRVLSLLRRTGRLPGADPVMLAISSRFPSNHQNPKVGEEAVRVGYWSREPSSSLCGNQPALQVRGSSATNRLHAAPALLTREYQSDDRRCQMTLTASSPSPPLTTPFHISESAPNPTPSHTTAPVPSAGAMPFPHASCRRGA